MYGTNDSFVDESTSAPRVALDEYRALLASMIDDLLAAGIRPILMTEPRWGARARNGLGENPNARLEEYVQAVRELAAARKLPLVDHFAHWTAAERAGTDTSSWTLDQCHPDPEGHRRMADLLFPVLRKELGQLPVRERPQ